MDKVSLLGEAIRYVKQLKEQVKLLEEQSKRKNEESVMFAKKSQVFLADEDVSDTSSNSCEFGNSDDPSSKANFLSLPEVEARVSKKNVLIRILCEKEKTVLVNIFREIEKLHLSIIYSSALSFGSSVLDTTIVAEVHYYYYYYTKFKYLLGITYFTLIIIKNNYPRKSLKILH